MSSEAMEGHDSKKLMNEWWMAGFKREDIPGLIEWAPWTASPTKEQCMAVTVQKNPALVVGIVNGAIQFGVVHISNITPVILGAGGDIVSVTPPNEEGS